MKSEDIKFTYVMKDIINNPEGFTKDSNDLTFNYNEYTTDITVLNENFKDSTKVFIFNDLIRKVTFSDTCLFPMDFDNKYICDIFINLYPKYKNNIIIKKSLSYNNKGSFHIFILLKNMNKNHVKELVEFMYEYKKVFGFTIDYSIYKNKFLWYSPFDLEYDNELEYIDSNEFFNKFFIDFINESVKYLEILK